MTQAESKTKIIDFYSALIMTRFLIRCNSSELKRLDKHIQRTYYLALDIMEYAQETENVLLFDEILLATNDLIPSKDSTVVPEGMRAKIDKVRRMFMVNVGDLLEQDVAFAWNYNCISQNPKRKYERFNVR